MKILLVSDEESKFIWDFFDKEKFRDIELIISCGDLKKAYLDFLVSMIPAPLYYVPGNHDKSFVSNPPEGCTCLHGKVVTYKGIRFFGLGGCLSPRKDTYEYTEEEMKKLIRKARWPLWKSGGYDVLVTHAPAAGIGEGQDLFHRGFQCFVTLNDRYKPAYHFFGHQHKRYGRTMPERFQRGGTTYLNACGYQILEI